MSSSWGARTTPTPPILWPGTYRSSSPRTWSTGAWWVTHSRASRSGRSRTSPGRPAYSKSAGPSTSTTPRWWPARLEAKSASPWQRPRSHRGRSSTHRPHPSSARRPWAVPSILPRSWMPTAPCTCSGSPSGVGVNRRRSGPSSLMRPAPGSPGGPVPPRLRWSPPTRRGRRGWSRHQTSSPTRSLLSLLLR